jgi:hypothetical protein
LAFIVAVFHKTKRGNSQSASWMISSFSEPRGTLVQMYRPLSLKQTAADLARDHGHEAVVELLNSIIDINSWHAKHERQGQHGAAGRQSALQQEARENAKKEAQMTSVLITDDLVNKHATMLQSNRGALISRSSFCPFLLVLAI